MTREHMIEIREAEYDALIKLYEAVSNLSINDFVDTKKVTPLWKLYDKAHVEVNK